MIRIENLSKNYAKFKVFENFNLNIERNKTTCILGESGSGKTTLLNVMSNLTDYQGKVDKIQCSYVFQTPNLFPNLTALQNLSLVCENSENIQKLCSSLGIYEKLNEYPSRLSGGQAQRVALARGVLFSSEVLLMDEPFSSLDLKVKMQAMQTLKSEFAKTNRTVIMVTHDIKEAVTMADRIILLSKGKIVGDISKINENTEKQLFGILTQDLIEKTN